MTHRQAQGRLSASGTFLGSFRALLLVIILVDGIEEAKLLEIHGKIIGEKSRQIGQLRILRLEECTKLGLETVVAPAWLTLAGTDSST